jgi:hypothetical protein
MQSALFVFACLQHDQSTDSLTDLFERLNEIFSEAQLPVVFTRKDRLLISRFENVGFYISIFNDKQEIKDWYEMAKDFELTAKPNPINRSDFENRITKKKSKEPELYNESHFLIGKKIFDEIDKLNISEIYLFL